MASYKKPTAKKVGNKYKIRFQYGRAENGKYKYKIISAQTKGELYKLYDDFMLRHGIAGSSSVDKQSLYSYINNWGELYYKPKVKEQTYVGFLNALNSRIKPYTIASMQMANLNVDMLQRYIQELIDAKYSRDTICKTWRYINKCLQYGIDKGELPNIPLRLIKMPTEENVLTKKKQVLPFSQSDIEKIKQEASLTYLNGRPKYVYGNAILLLLNTGLRIGELMALTWADVDFENRLITVNKSMETFQDKSENAKKKTKSVIGKTKTKTSVRKVLINNTAYELLVKIRKTNIGHINDNDNVILSSKFTIPSTRNISRCLEKITKTLLPICKHPGFIDYATLMPLCFSI